jgi:hypothetical protein
MPTRTKRRLIAATMAAVALIGTAVGVGIYSSANAAGNRSGTASLECLPDTPPASESAPPSSTAPPPSSSEAAPPAEEPAEEAPAEEAPAEEAPAEEAPAEEAPAEEAPPAEQPAEEAPEQGAEDNEGVQEIQSMRRPRQPQQPEEPQQPEQPAPEQPEEPQQPAPEQPAPEEPQQPEAPGNESGPSAPNTPEAPDPGDTEEEFENPECLNQDIGPFATDFINIRNVEPQRLDPRPTGNASRGTFTSRCGTNAEEHRDSSNFIVSPGVANGAEHTHDYIGNTTTGANSNNESLAAGGTTCANPQDLSAYFYPVIRVRDADGGGEPDGTNPHNLGRILRASSVNITFRGNAQGDVVAMPRFIRVLTGNAKTTIQGGVNQNAKWTCTGFRDRITPKYPICPRGSRVQQISDFPGCWDGQNIDSANHRTHVAFADNTGACPEGFVAIPQLRMTLTYDIPRGRVFAVDAFPQVKHAPETYHNDFVNVMTEELMNRVVRCINSDRRC